MNRLPTKSNGPIRVGTVSKQRRDNDVAPSSGPLSAATPSERALPSPAFLKLLRFKAVQERTGLSRSTIWRLEQRGAFPRHRQISANAVAWVEEEIIRWITSK